MMEATCAKAAFADRGQMQKLRPAPADGKVVIGGGNHGKGRRLAARAGLVQRFLAERRVQQVALGALARLP